MSSSMPLRTMAAPVIRELPAPLQAGPELASTITYRFTGTDPLGVSQ